MVVQFSFTIERTFLSKRNHRKAMNEANRKAMEWVQRYVIPRKFTARARWEFPGHFGPRSAKHKARKQRRFGHDLPLVYTGKMRSRVLGEHSEVRATYKHATLTMRPGHAIRAENRSELEFLTNRHKRRMAEVIQKTYMKLSQDRRFLTRQTRRSR